MVLITEVSSIQRSPNTQLPYYTGTLNGALIIEVSEIQRVVIGGSTVLSNELFKNVLSIHPSNKLPCICIEY